MSEIKLETGVVLKSIPVSPNKDYMAGSDGQIYSRTHYTGFGRKERGAWYPLKGHRSGRSGYQIITMCHKNKKISKTVHRLVCMAFHGMPKVETLQTRHLDGNALNNDPKNLKWGTQEENWLDRRAHGRGCEGEKHPMAKLTDREREHIRWAIKKGLCSQHHAARMLNMTQGAISAVVHSKSE